MDGSVIGRLEQLIERCGLCFLALLLALRELCLSSLALALQLNVSESRGVHFERTPEAVASDQDDEQEDGASNAQPFVQSGAGGSSRFLRRYGGRWRR